MTRLRTVWIAILISLSASLCSAEVFERVGPATLPYAAFSPGAVAQGMGGGMATAWDTPGGGYWNPARPSGVPAFGGSFSYEEPLLIGSGDWKRRTHAVTGSVGGLTLSLFRDKWSMEEVTTVRTAYNPEGISQTWEYGYESHLASLSWDALHREHSGSVSVLSVGAGFRRIKTHLNEFSGEADDFDLGVIYLRRFHREGSVGLQSWGLGVSKSNVRNELLNSDLMTWQAPGAWRAGVRAEWGVAEGTRGTPLVSAITTLDWQRWRVSRDWLDDPSLAVGVEALLSGIIALRYGYGDMHGSTLYKNSSYGIGLRLALAEDQVVVRADVSLTQEKPFEGAVDSKSLMDNDSLETYSLRIEWRP